ncbi:uncharacterized protein VTP21DRAFT_3575 [Calcarisporiella thermophila]|uniref:uncharacterized protein n=1 Tax=Calcarisporiella thermophila TaxID=911321 RepID=UPI0037437178
MSKIWVGNLPESISIKEVEDYFNEHGRVVSVNLKSNYGFVEFENERDCQNVVSRCDGAEIGGSKIRVELPRHERRDFASNECFKCGRPGHFARDCPSNTSPPPRSRHDRPSANGYGRDYPPREDRYHPRYDRGPERAPPPGGRMYDEGYSRRDYPPQDRYSRDYPPGHYPPPPPSGYSHYKDDYDHRRYPPPPYSRMEPYDTRSPVHPPGPPFPGRDRYAPYPSRDRGISPPGRRYSDRPRPPPRDVPPSAGYRGGWDDARNGGYSRYDRRSVSPPRGRSPPRYASRRPPPPHGQGRMSPPPRGRPHSENRMRRSPPPFSRR